MTGSRLQPRDRRILGLAIPALGSLAVEPLYVLVDTAIVGRLGTAPLGGLALASTVLNTSFWLFNFLSYGTTARVSFLTGRGDHRGAAAVATQGLWLAIGIGIVVGAAMAAGARAMSVALGGDGEVLEAASTYLQISAAGLPLVLISLVGHGYLRGLSDTRTPLRVVVVANAVNVVLEVSFVYGLDLGVAGSAWSTVIAQAVAAAWFLVLITRRVRSTAAPMQPVVRLMRGLVVVGSDLFLRTGALLAVLVISTSVAARLGAEVLAGHQIALQVGTLFTLSIDCLAIAAQALIGTTLGAGDVAEARALAVRMLRMGVIGGLVLMVAAWLMAAFGTGIFSTDPAVMHNARLALLMVGVLQVPNGIAFVLDGVLMGASDFRFLKWLMVVSLAGFLPAAAVVLAWRTPGIVGLWSALVVWMLVRVAGSVRRFSSDGWTAISRSG